MRRPPSALVLIDTPGYSAAMLRDLGGDLAAFLAAVRILTPTWF